MRARTSARSSEAAEAPEIDGTWLSRHGSDPFRTGLQRRIFHRRIWPGTGFLEEQGEEEHHADRADCRDHPGGSPVGFAVDLVMSKHEALGNRADEHARAIRDERDEPLRCRPDFLIRLLVDIDLPCHEKEIEAWSVQNDAQQ